MESWSESASKDLRDLRLKLWLFVLLLLLLLLLTVGLERAVEDEDEKGVSKWE